MNEDAYAVCRYVLHYHEKNGYVATRDTLGISREYLDLLVKNGVVEFLPSYEGGPPVKVVLTAKGRRMAEERR